MGYTQESGGKKGSSGRQQLEDVISKAIKKIGGSKENDLCKYIPIPSGGYIHHFTLRKMKTEQPDELSAMINRFIINVDVPMTVPPKPRAPRGTRKRRDQITFTKTEIERMLNMARQVGDNEIIAKLTPKKSLAACKRELILSVKVGKIEPELWNAYVEAVNAVNNLEGIKDPSSKSGILSNSLAGPSAMAKSAETTISVTT